MKQIRDCSVAEWLKIRNKPSKRKKYISEEEYEYLQRSIYQLDIKNVEKIARESVHQDYTHGPCKIISIETTL